MEPRNERQEKEALLEFVSALNSLELAVLIHKKQTPNAVRAVASRLLNRLKYTTNYKAMLDVRDAKDPVGMIAYYWQPINDNGGVECVLAYEPELRISIA